MAASKTIRVYEVVADCAGGAPGPNGDGIATNRFRKEAEARTFASTATHYGHPAVVNPSDAPGRVAQRWAREGKIR